MTIDGKGGNHDDTSNGGVEQMPGAPDVVITNFDSIPGIPNMLHDGGVRWLNNTTGNFRKAYRLYDGESNDNGSLGKAGGVGGAILLMPDPAPLEIGNRVWNDPDGDGVQDPGETGMPGVTLRLYNARNTLVGKAVTDANGEYYFVGSTSADPNQGDSIGQVNGGIAYNSNYQIRLDDFDDRIPGRAPEPEAPESAGPVRRRRDLLTAPIRTCVKISDPVNSPFSGEYPVISLTTGGPGKITTHSI